jgi:simple sugar transport system ATP-binding protein
MQGVAISRAMYFKASLVILDEPTTALAVSGVQTVLGFIRKLREDRNLMHLCHSQPA